jgi:protein O-GlcNAc transferase
MAHTVEDKLRQGIRDYSAGRLADAEAAYRLILGQVPNQPDALHLLGLVKNQEGKPEAAVKLIRQAIAANPSAAIFHVSLGNAFRTSDRLDEAEGSYRKALKLEPSLAEALGNLGDIQAAQGRPEDAKMSYRAALELKPNLLGAANNLGNLLADEGDFQSAAECFRSALRAAPDQAEALSNLGNTLTDLGHLDEAVDVCRQAVDVDEDNGAPWNNLARALWLRGDLTNALPAAQKATFLAPRMSQAFLTLGNICRSAGDFETAVENYRMALKLAPDDAGTLAALGIGEGDLGHYDDAITWGQKAIDLDPGNLPALGSLADCFLKQGRVDDAVRTYRDAATRNPKASEPASNLALVLHYAGGSRPEDLYQAARQWAIDHGTRPTGSTLPHSTQRDPDRSLKIGYVSGDWVNHSVAWFANAFLAGHNRNQFQVFCYDTRPATTEKSNRLATTPLTWRNLAGCTDPAAAKLIRDDEIDILIDITGHTGGNRLGVFAHRPAPVQVTYLGFPGTTGLETMDYRLTDAWADPEGDGDQWYTEQLVRLDGGFLCYTPPEDTPDVAAAPVLDTGRITFGSFNNLSKVTPDAVHLWARILDAVPHSRLLLKTKALADPGAQKRIKGLFQEQGISDDRLELLAMVPDTRGHLGVYDRIDIALDTFPYNGTTTTVEALWMGVPTVTFSGNRHAARVGASLLHMVGLEELIAASPEEYVERAVALAKDPAKMSDLRSGMRDRLRASRLLDADAFTKTLEDAYRQMWRTWCEKNQ